MQLKPTYLPFYPYVIRKWSLIVSCLATSAKILRRFKESIPYDKQRLKLMSKAYQAGKLKYKKIADQEGDHLGWELLNCYKDLISSQIQCNQFEDAMKTFKKMKLYNLNSMNPRDVQDCIDLLYDPNKNYRNQSSMANDFLHYHVFGVLFGLKAQALYGLGDTTNGDIWLNDTLDLCVSFHQTFSQMVSMVSTKNNPRTIHEFPYVSEDGSISEMFFLQLVHTFLMASEYAFSRINGISFLSEEGIRSDVRRRQYFQHLMGHLFSGNLFAKSKHASYYIGSVMKNQFVKFETVIPFIEHFIRCLNEKCLEEMRKETKETDSDYKSKVDFTLSGQDQRKKMVAYKNSLMIMKHFKGLP
jgi:hypothetical protein